MNTLQTTKNILPTNFLVREAKISDAQQVANIHIAARKDGYKGLIDKNYLDSLIVNSEHIINMEWVIKKSWSGFLVYEEEWQILGFIVGGKSRNDPDCSSEIYAFYVDPKHQKKGIWTKLFTKFFEKFNQWNICLWTLPHSKGEAFYKKMGGILDAEKEQYIWWKPYKEIRYIRKHKTQKVLTNMFK